ncbi:Phospholipase/lecithinase/hemolysin [uncultured Gammaproteobacteria bacterium]|nr:Phospholipase/lecithinase/hemolysin [uncultured Gammaproteobacteria bacterium]
MLTKIIKQSVWFLLMLILASCVKNDKVPKSIVVFGDSLSDQGNIFSIVNHVTDLKKSICPRHHRHMTGMRLAINY